MGNSSADSCIDTTLFSFDGNCIVKSDDLVLQKLSRNLVSIDTHLLTIRVFNGFNVPWKNSLGAE